jgi:hypothetical protein
MSSPSDRQEQPPPPQSQQTPRSIASNNFLSLLREHGNFGRTIRDDHGDQQQVPDSSLSQDQIQTSNEDTVRASNTEVDTAHRKTTSALPDLFIPPPPPSSRGVLLVAPPTTNAPQSNTATTTSPIPYPGILPRTSLDIQSGTGIPKVDSTVTLPSSNRTPPVPATTTINITGPLPPRPPSLSARDQSVIYTSSPYQSYNESDSEDALHGEGIDDDEDGSRYDPDRDAATTGNRKTLQPSAPGNQGRIPQSFSMSSPRTQERVTNAFLHPHNNSPENKMPKQQPVLSPHATKRPESIGNRARSVSFGQYPKQSPHHNVHPQHQSNPSMNASAGSDVILNHFGGAADDYAIGLGLEPNMMLHPSNSNEAHHQRDHSITMRRRRLQSDATRTINLNDLLSSGPYEIEAETNILKAIEEKPSRHRRYISETSTILSGVPDTMAHDFSLEEADDPPLGDGSQDGVYASSYHGTSSTEEGEPSQGTGPPPPPPLQPLVDVEEEMPLIKVDKKKNQLHRRTMSVEDRLAGLTFEYSNLEDGKNGSAAGNRNSDNVGSTNVSSGEAFRQNTAVISRMEETNSPAGRNRKYTDFSDKLPAVVETDEESPGTEGGRDEESNFGENDADGNDPNTTDSRRTRRKEAQQKILSRATDHLKEDLEVWRTFFSPRKENVKTYFKFVTIYMGVPLIGAAFVLFYAFDNPPTYDKDAITNASASWWLLFCMRQVITLSLALLMQLLIIDFLSVGTRVMLRIVGPILTLLIVQSRGWPFVFFWWSMFDFALIQGDRELSQHWLFWQDFVGLFNTSNPSGNVVDNPIYLRVLVLTAVISVVVAIKRFVVGLWLSRNTFSEFNREAKRPIQFYLFTAALTNVYTFLLSLQISIDHYGDPLAILMNKMVLVSQVAQLAKKLHKSSLSKVRKPFSNEAA